MQAGALLAVQVNPLCQWVCDNAAYAPPPERKGGGVVVPWASLVLRLCAPHYFSALSAPRVGRYPHHTHRALRLNPLYVSNAAPNERS